MARGKQTPKKTPNAPKQKSKVRVEQEDLRKQSTTTSSTKQQDSTIADEAPTSTNLKRKLLFVLICLIAGCLNSYNGYALFENDCYFSHLSNLEREMTFRTEMGLYYSYYKTFVHAPTITDGFLKLVSNNRTEYPSTINTLQRFNLYPELVVGIAYRIFDQAVNFFKVEAKNCWTVTRSDDRNAVESCSGLGDPAVFYMTSVYLWNFIGGASIAGLAALLSNSLVGTLVCCLCYFFNFEEATRIQWTPPLRESFAYPLLILQMLLTSRLIARGRVDVVNCVIYVTVTTCCLLCWQFSQFVFVTEISCLFAVFSLHAAIHWRHLQFISCMHLCSMFIAYVLLFLNEMLFSSLYTAAVMTCIIVCQARVLNGHRTKLKAVAQLAAFAVITVTIKVLLKFILKVEDDGHVWSLLRSKISDYSDFDTMLYTCAPEFDFLTLDYVKSISTTLGLAFLLFSGVVAWAWLHRLSFAPELIYNFYQCLAFGVMAFTIMRLKMLLTPHLCIVSSVGVCSRYFPNKSIRMAAAVGLVAMLLLPGISTVLEQHSHVGEYSNPDLEELMLFIDNYAEENDSFTGPMPLMANIMLSTDRPIVNHPHYENAALREKTKTIYTLLSRKSIKEVHANLKSVHARYVVIPRAWCLGKTRTGCSLTGIWDKLDPENRHRSLVCQRLMNDETEELFESIFQNDEYSMLSVL